MESYSVQQRNGSALSSACGVSFNHVIKPKSSNKMKDKERRFLYTRKPSEKSY